MTTIAEFPLAAPVGANRETARAAGKGTLAILSLARGRFALGTTEFASTGRLQQSAPDPGIRQTEVTHAIEAHAFGVIVGTPGSVAQIG